jgi:hypothetical protein
LSEEQQKSPEQYGYRGTEKVEIDGYQFRQAKKEINQLVNDETFVGHLMPFKRISNKEPYGEATKKQIEKGEFIQVPDIKALMDLKQPQVFITERGKQLMMLNLSLEQTHFKNIDEGIAVDVETLKEEYKKSNEPKLKKV